MTKGDTKYIGPVLCAVQEWRDTDDRNALILRPYLPQGTTSTGNCLHGAVSRQGESRHSLQ